MNDAVQREDPFHIEASPYLADDRTRVLKQGETFAIFDRYGDVGAFSRDQQGVVHAGTRYLSHLFLRLNGERPLLLSSTIKRDNLVLAVDLTNPNVYDGAELILPQGSLHIFRSKFLWQGVCYERLRVSNFSVRPATAELLIQFDADYADIFQLRGIKRARIGERLPTEMARHWVRLGYRGLDGLTRQTHIQFSRVPTVLTGASAQFRLEMAPKSEKSICIAVACCSEEETPAVRDYDDAMRDMMEALAEVKMAGCMISTSSAPFNNWLERSGIDLYMMITDTGHGNYPYAGVPWYSTVFGRDGIIAALQTLWFDPSLARGVLNYLARHQARELNAARDAEPGKILHETRKGEMANLGEVPFQYYYGSVDSTPLFVMLAAAYYQRTGDIALVRELWPNIEAALQWIDRYGDFDGDGFVEYERHSDDGLVNQGWKDSNDAVFDQHGELAQGAIALCEVQGYVYAAKLGAAQMATALGKNALTSRLVDEAETLKTRFDEAFWCEDLQTYALALDGAKRPLRVRTSNAGHALYTGIAGTHRAAAVAQTLLNPESFSGWGVRTVASSAPNYNPMSYHNGSVWPHDNAMIAVGLARYGFKREALTILNGLFDTSGFMDHTRLPELFCGFIRRPDEAPTLYPVACSPQAWAAGAVFMALEACLGIAVIATPRPQVIFSAPILPEILSEVRIDRLRVGGAQVDLSVRCYREDVAVHALERSGDVQIVVVK